MAYAACVQGDRLRCRGLWLVTLGLSLLGTAWPRDGLAQDQGATPSAASLIDSSAFDRATSPCDDFYQYANGGWLKGIPPAPPGQEHNFSDEQRARAQVMVDSLLEQARRAAPTTTDVTTRVVGYFYGSCLTTGSAGDTLHRRHCVRVTDSMLGNAIGELYARAVWPAATAAAADTLLTQLQAATRQRFQEGMTWLSDQGRRHLLATAVPSPRLGVPKAWYNFKALTLSPTDFADNQTRVGKLYMRTRQMRPAQVYRTFASERAISAAMLQPPVFDPTGDPAVNYGAAGFLVGREIMGQYPEPKFAFMTVNPDIVNVLSDLSAWGAADSVAFVQRATPLIAQFNAAGGAAVYYSTISGLYRHLADLGGLVIAYEAWQQATAGQPNRTIGGLTPAQRFFVAFAQLWRTDGWGGRANLAEMPDPKPYWYDEDRGPARLGVNVLLANLPAFAEAFGCKAGEPMARPADQRIVLY